MSPVLSRAIRIDPDRYCAIKDSTLGRGGTRRGADKTIAGRDGHAPLFVILRSTRLANAILERATGGERRFRLPRRCRRVIELFSGRTVATDAAEFKDVLRAPDTVLYELEF